jgi:hypothetical protein
MMRKALVIAVGVLLVGVQARAQVAPPPDPLESMAFRMGPLGISPALAITDLGVDSNIFNESGAPREDFTATITPQLTARFRAGRVLLSGFNSTGFVYYLDFADERSINYVVNGRADFDGGRFQPFVAGDLQDTHERLNQEIDVRAGRMGRTGSAGLKILAGPRTAFVVSGRWHDFEFDSGETFEGVPLSTSLNRQVDTYEASVEHALTALTTLNLTAAWQEDRFDRSPERDARAFSIVPALNFDPIALVQGTLAVGYKRFEPGDTDLPRFSGVVVRTAITYTLLERTRFEFRATRDVQYSFETLEPYYVGSGARLHITYRLTGPFDLQAGAGRDRLSYQSFGSSLAERVDRVDLFSAGVGYRLAENARLGLNWEYTRRLSDRPDRRYDRRRIVASMLYGL